MGISGDPQRWAALRVDRRSGRGGSRQGICQSSRRLPAPPAMAAPLAWVPHTHNTPRWNNPRTHPHTPPCTCSHPTGSLRGRTKQNTHVHSRQQMRATECPTEGTNSFKASHYKKNPLGKAQVQLHSAGWCNKGPCKPRIQDGFSSSSLCTVTIAMHCQKHKGNRKGKLEAALLIFWR